MCKATQELDTTMILEAPQGSKKHETSEESRVPAGIAANCFRSQSRDR